MRLSGRVAGRALLGIDDFPAGVRVLGLHENASPVHHDRVPADDQAGLDLADRVKFHIGRGVLKTDRVIDGDKMDSLLGGRFVTFNTYTKKDKVCIVTERLKRPDRDQCT